MDSVPGETKVERMEIIRSDIVKGNEAPEHDTSLEADSFQSNKPGIGGYKLTVMPQGSEQI
jgi:hypothetical protein